MSYFAIKIYPLPTETDLSQLETLYQRLHCSIIRFQISGNYQYQQRCFLPLQGCTQKNYNQYLNDFYCQQVSFNPNNHKIDRSSHQRCSVKKDVLKNLQNSQENTCPRVSFLIKLQASCQSPFFNKVDTSVFL